MAAELVSTRVLGGILGSGDAWLQVKYPEQPGVAKDIPAKAATFFRIDAPTLTGISLDLGSLLGMANNLIPAELYSGSTAGTDGTKIAGIDVVSTIVKGGDGNYYLMVYSPDNVTDYDGVRLKLTFGGLNVTVASNLRLNVYHAFTFDATPTCGLASFADEGKATGVSVAIGDLVLNPSLAVDNDVNTHSTITTGTLNLLGSVFQTYYFNGLSAEQDYFKIKFKIGGGSLLDLNVLGNFEIRAYNGDALVYTKKLQGALVNGLDLLTLLKSGDPITAPFAPGVPFDRVAIGINTTAALNLASSPLEVYHVERYGLSGSPLTCVDPEPPLADEGDDHMLDLNHRECADELVGHGYANFAFNAIDGDPGTYAVLEATSGSLLGLGSYSGHIELGYGSEIPANTTSYLKIGMEDEGLLSALLDGSLGGLLGDVLDNVLFGNHFFDIQVNNGANEVLSGSSANAFNGLPIRVVQDKYGSYYVAITPTSPYRSIKIIERFPALVGAEASRTMKVYGLCYSTGSEDCEQAFSTYSLSNGISLNLLGLGSAGVKNAQLAIDDNDPSVEDDNTYSEIGIGTAGIGASAFQFVDFHTLSAPADYFKVKIGFDNGSLLNVELLNNVEIRAYDGETLVYSERLHNGLVAGLDILGLLTATNEVTIPIGPGKAFDRVAIGVSTLVDVNVLPSPLHVYSIKRFGADCPDPNPLPTTPPTESPFNDADCSVELGEFNHVNFAYNAIDNNIDTYATISAGSGVALGAGAFSGYIEMAFDAPVPALETSYIRIDMPDAGLLDALVGGSLGGILADVGDLVVFGNHYFDLSVRDATGAEIYKESSLGGFSNDNVRIVQDKFGRFYIAFTTATTPYQSVRITLNKNALVGLDAVTTMSVYSMCRETVFDPCEQATFTSFDGTGLTANLLEGANPAGVINPQYVIDDNNSNYAEFSLGTAAIGATLYQDIYYKTKVTTNTTDKVRLRMQVPSALLNFDLLGAYKVYLYNGEEEVYNATLQNALINGLDLLSLLNSNGRVNVDFEPGAGITYDRVRFEVGSVIGLGIANSVRLYNVYRISDACPDPDFEQPPFEVCADVIVDAGENVDDIQNLIDGNHNSYATIRSDAGLVGGIGAYSGHLELGFGGIIPAGTSSYIRIGYDEGILNSLLAGSLGGVVNDLLNGIALGDHYFNVIVKNGPNIVLSRSSSNLFAGADSEGKVRLVQDTKGRYYLEITPTVDYQSVRLEDRTTALLGLLSSEGHLDVYGMCHTPTTFECAAAFSTSYEGSGLNLDALNIGGAGVQNAFWAIDQNTSSASTLSLGTLGVGGTIQQNIKFDRDLAVGDEILLRMTVGGGTLNATILEGLEIVYYLDGQEVGVKDFNTAFIEASVETILNASTPEDVAIDVDQPIDEIAIRLSGLLAIGIAPSVSIYHVAPICVSYAQSSLKVTKDGAFADGVDFNEVTATIIDASNVLVSNKEVEFTVVHVDGSITTETGTTNADGEAVVQITSTLAGVASITATVEGMVITIGSPAEVTFVIPNNLSITKVSDETDGRVTAGESTTFTVTITNNGPAPIAVGKVIPLNERPSAGLTITNCDVTSGNATVSGTDNSALVTVGDTEIPVDGTITITITADVAANAPANVSNGIDVWGPDRDPDTDTPDDTDGTLDIPVDRDYGLAGNITKIAADGVDAVAIAGDEFEYTVAVTNGGPSTILSGTVLYLQDVLSTGQTISSITTNSANITVGTVDGDGVFTVTANEDIEVTEGFGLTVIAVVAADIVANVVNNIINIWSIDPAGDYSTPEGTATTPDIPVDRDYGFDDDAITKVGDAATATAGTAYSYTVTVENQGPSVIGAGTALYLQDAVSAEQTVTGITSATGAVGAIGTEGEFTFTPTAAIAVGGTFNLTVTVDVDAAITASVINNTIKIWANDPAGDYSTPDGTAKTPDIPVDRDYGWNDPDAVKKAGNKVDATAGEAYSYTVTLKNKGVSTINAGTELYLQDIVSAGQTLGTITSSNGTLGTVGTNGEFVLTVGTAVATDETIVLTVNVTVAADIVSNEINNRINIWSEDPAGDFDTPEGTGVTPDIPVLRVSDFTVVKSTTATEAIAGESVDFKVVLTNSGPSTAFTGHKIVIKETPGGMVIAGTDISVISGDAKFDGVYDAMTGEFTIELTNNVNVGGVIELKIVGHVPANATGIVKNGIEVDGDDDETPPIPVVDKVVFDVVKTTTATTAIAGESVDFKVVITNNGPSTAKVGRQIIITEKPYGLTITGGDIMVTSGNATFDGNYNETTGVFTIEVSNEVAVGDTIELDIVGHVPADATGTIKNGIDVEGDEDETPPIPVDNDSKLSITKVADQTRVKAGESTSFTLTITNNGPSEIALGKVINLSERPSTGITITGYELTSGNGIATGAGNTATVTTSSAIAVGGTITVKVTADVHADASETITNGITVWGPDKDPGNDPGDDKDDTPEIPVDHEGPTAADDAVDVKAGTSSKVDLLANDITGASPIDPSTVTLVKQPTRGIAIVNADGTVTYTPNMGQEGTDEFTYQVKDENGNLSNVATVTVMIIKDPLSIPNTFTPNGDGLNDVFVIKGLDQYSENELIILNRWGNQVYMKRNYANDWTGEGLNEGTYYYILKARNLSGEWKVHKGHITLIRITR